MPRPSHTTLQQLTRPFINLTETDTKVTRPSIHSSIATTLAVFIIEAAAGSCLGVQCYVFTYKILRLYTTTPPPPHRGNETDPIHAHHSTNIQTQAIKQTRVNEQTDRQTYRQLWTDRYRRPPPGICK